MRSSAVNTWKEVKSRFEPVEIHPYRVLWVSHPG